MCNDIAPTSKALDFTCIAVKRNTQHKYKKEDEDIYMAVVESIRLMTLMYLLHIDEIHAIKTHA